MLRKSNEQNKINFLDKNDTAAQLQSEKAAKIANEEQRFENLKEEQKSRKLDGKDNGLLISKTIASATYNPESISDNSGPSKQMKTPISNSIWDPNRLNKAIIADSKAETIKEKETISETRQKQEQSRIDMVVESLKTTDQTKAAAITPMNNFQGHKFITPQNGMSMFDNGNFDRLPKQTDGERVVEENAQKKAQKDESWKNNGKSFSSKDVINRMFDGLLGSLEKKE